MKNPEQTEAIASADHEARTHGPTKVNRIRLAEIEWKPVSGPMAASVSAQVNWDRRVARINPSPARETGRGGL